MSFLKKLSATTEREGKCKVEVFLPETVELAAAFQYSFQENLMEKFTSRTFDSLEDVDLVNDEIEEHVSFILKHALPSLRTYFDRQLREKSPYIGVSSISTEADPKLVWQNNKAMPNQLLLNNTCVLKVEFFIMERELSFDLQTIVESHPKP